MSALLLASEASHGVATSPLTAAILLPFLGAVVVALVPSGRAELHRLVALLFASAPARSRSGCWPTSTPTTPASSTR